MMEKKKNFLMITDSYDIRRYLAILFSAGGAISMTLLLAWIIFLLSGVAHALLTIAIGLLILIGLMQTGFVALLVKRSVVIAKDRFELKDSVNFEGDTIITEHPAPPTPRNNQ